MKKLEYLYIVIPLYNNISSRVHKLYQRDSHLKSTPKSIRKTLETRVWRIRINVSQAKPLVRNYVSVRDTPAQETTYLNLVVMVLEQSGSIQEHVPLYTAQLYILPKCLVYILLYLIYRLEFICLVYIFIGATFTTYFQIFCYINNSSPPPTHSQSTARPSRPGYFWVPDKSFPPTLALREAKGPKSICILGWMVVSLKHMPITKNIDRLFYSFKTCHIPNIFRLT